MWGLSVCGVKEAPQAILVPNPGGQPLPQTHAEVVTAQRRVTEGLGVRMGQLRISVWKD